MIFWKKFEVYHKLVKELVEPLTEKGTLYVDQKAAIVFEMRNFKKYYPYTLRMLKGLHEKCVALQNQSQRLLNELGLTIEHIQKKL